MKNVILCALVVVVVLFIVYQFNPTMFGMMSYEGFEEKKEGFEEKKEGFEEKKEGFKDP